VTIRLINDVQAGGGEAALKGFTHRVGDFSHLGIKARGLCVVNS
jgi:hypothetical protein